MHFGANVSSLLILWKNNVLLAQKVWLWSYNNERPNMGNGGMTPAQKLKMVA